MTEEIMSQPRDGGWKPWAAAVFAAAWGGAGALMMQPPARAFMEDAAAYSGKLVGFGMAPGLLAAAIAHVLFLRGHGRRAKWLTYLAGAVVGGLASLLAHA